MSDSTLATDEPTDTPQDLGDLHLAVLASTINEALTLKGCLAAAGIPATIGDQNLMMQGGGWMGGVVGGGVRVLVPRALIPRANEVLAEFRRGSFEIEGDPDPALAPPTHATDLALWGPDLSAILSLWLTPLFGATLHWMNSRKLGQAPLRRHADIGLALAFIATAAGFWLMRERSWSIGTPFADSAFMGVYTTLWYLLIAHPQSRHIARSFGHKYRHRPVWAAAAVAFVVMLSIGWLGES